MTDRPKTSRWVLALARWALLFGLIGVSVIVSTWLHDAPSTDSGENALLVVGIVFVALAFVLAPFVRNAFGLPSFSQGRTKRAYRTTLDEIREGGEASGLPDVVSPSMAEQTRISSFGRIVIALYAVFAVVLVSALMSL